MVVSENSDNFSIAGTNLLMPHSPKEVTRDKASPPNLHEAASTLLPSLTELLGVFRNKPKDCFYQKPPHDEFSCDDSKRKINFSDDSSDEELVYQTRHCQKELNNVEPSDLDEKTEPDLFELSSLEDSSSEEETSEKVNGGKSKSKDNSCRLSFEMKNDDEKINNSAILASKSEKAPININKFSEDKHNERDWSKKSRKTKETFSEEMSSAPLNLRVEKTLPFLPFINKTNQNKKIYAKESENLSKEIEDPPKNELFIGSEDLNPSLQLENNSLVSFSHFIKSLTNKEKSQTNASTKPPDETKSCTNNLSRKNYKECSSNVRISPMRNCKKVAAIQPLSVNSHSLSKPKTLKKDSHEKFSPVKKLELQKNKLDPEQKDLTPIEESNNDGQFYINKFISSIVSKFNLNSNTSWKAEYHADISATISNDSRKEKDELKYSDFSFNVSARVTSSTDKETLKCNEGITKEQLHMPLKNNKTLAIDFEPRTPRKPSESKVDELISKMRSLVRSEPSPMALESKPSTNEKNLALEFKTGNRTLSLSPKKASGKKSEMELITESSSTICSFFKKSSKHISFQLEADHPGKIGNGSIKSKSPTSNKIHYPPALKNMIKGNSSINDSEFTPKVTLKSASDNKLKHNKQARKNVSKPKPHRHDPAAFKNINKGGASIKVSKRIANITDKSVAGNKMKHSNDKKAGKKLSRPKNQPSWKCFDITSLKRKKKEEHNFSLKPNRLSLTSNKEISNGVRKDLLNSPYSANVSKDKDKSFRFENGFSLKAKEIPETDLFDPFGEIPEVLHIKENNHQKKVMSELVRSEDKTEFIMMNNLTQKEEENQSSDPFQSLSLNLSSKFDEANNKGKKAESKFETSGSKSSKTNCKEVGNRILSQEDIFNVSPANSQKKDIVTNEGIGFMWDILIDL